MLLIYVGLLPLLMVLVNSVTMRIAKLHSGAVQSKSISVLIPMRNEASNVAGVIQSVLAQSELNNYEIVILNDQSTDATEFELQKFKSQILIIEGADPPDGWLGKNFACNQLAAVSQGEFLVFIDADVRLHPLAISSVLTTMKTLRWDFISAYPRQIAESFLERFMQPLLQWSWLSSVPLRLAESFRVQSMTIANGQFFIVSADAYRRIGGHESIKTEILDDLKLARSLIKAGFHGGVAEGSALAQCRMYESSKELTDGYTKSLWRAFGGITGTVFTLLLLTLTQIFPFSAALLGNTYGVIAYLLVALSHAIAAARTKSGFANVFMHPISILILFYLIARSYYRGYKGTLTWRGRVLS